jgi:hypothetical protein
MRRPPNRYKQRVTRAKRSWVPATGHVAGPGDHSHTRRRRAVGDVAGRGGQVLAATSGLQHMDDPARFVVGIKPFERLGHLGGNLCIDACRHRRGFPGSRAVATSPA